MFTGLTMYVGTRLRPVAEVIADALDTDNPSVAMDYVDHLLNYALDCPRELRLAIRAVCNRIRASHGRREFLAAPTSAANQPGTPPSNNNNKVHARLREADAEELWRGLREAGLIKPDSYELVEDVSKNQATYIADQMGSLLKLKNKWKPFIDLWDIPTMSQLAHNWAETGQLPKDHEAIEKALGIAIKKDKR